MARTPKKTKIDKKVSNFIKDKYYPITHKGVEKILTTDKSKIGNKNFRVIGHNWDKSIEKQKGIDRARRDQETVNMFDGLPTKPGTVPNNKLCKKHFDEVHAPVISLVPEKLKKLYGGIQSVVLRKINGKPNNVRYYTKNKKLTNQQCKILYDHENWRGIHGFTINDKPLEGKYFASYIEWLINNTKDDKEAEQETYKAISLPVKTNPDGSREPGVIQMGLNSYMKRNSLTNPVQIIDAHVKKEKLKIFDGINLGSVLSELNISPAEAFDYVCAYLNKNRDKKRLHTQDRELNRGASALKNLIDFYNAEKLRTTIAKRKDKKIKIFGYKELMDCKQYADYCSLVGDIQIRNYETFKKWIRNKLDAIALLNK